MQVVANGAYHHLASVEPNADTQCHTMLATYRLGIGLHRYLHGQGRVAGAQGVVFMRNGGAKQGHNAVAQHLVHGTFIAVYRVHHNVNGGIEELLGGFRVEVFDEFGGVFDVGKQDGDLFTFAFQRRTGGEDFLGQVGRRLGERRPVLGGGGCWGGCWGYCRGFRPEQAAARIIDHLGVGIEEFVFKRLQLVVVEIELDLEGAIGDPPTLPQEVYSLIKRRIEVHHCSSACASAGTVQPCCCQG